MYVVSDGGGGVKLILVLFVRMKVCYLEFLNEYIFLVL